MKRTISKIYQKFHKVVIFQEFFSDLQYQILFLGLKLACLQLFYRPDCWNRNIPLFYEGLFVLTDTTGTQIALASTVLCRLGSYKSDNIQCAHKV